VPSDSSHRFVHHGAFGNDRFGVLAERFARFFGTPRFIIAQEIARLTTELHTAICRDGRRDG